MGPHRQAGQPQPCRYTTSMSFCLITIPSSQTLESLIYQGIETRARNNPVQINSLISSGCCDCFGMGLENTIHFFRMKWCPSFFYYASIIVISTLSILLANSAVLTNHNVGKLRMKAGQFEGTFVCRRIRVQFSRRPVVANRHFLVSVMIC